MRKFIILFYSIFIFMNIDAQQLPRFSQSFGVANFQNPALTGSIGQSRIQSTYRNHWPKLFNGLKTFYIGFELVNAKLPFDIGVYQMYNDIQNGIENNYYGGLCLSRSFNLNESLSFKVGLSGCYTSRSISANLISINPIPSTSRNYGSGLLLGGGFTISGNYFLLGYSALAINQPVIYIGNIYNVKYNISHSLQAAIRYPLFDKEDLRGPYLTVQILKSSKTLITSGLIYRFQNFKLGFAYRHDNSCVGSLGFIRKNLNLTYSYDYFTSKPGNSIFGGSHEIALSYIFGKENLKRPSNKWISSLF